MSSGEYFDKGEFISYFRDETDELLQSIDDDLLKLEASIEREVDPEIVNSLFRALHTVKGSAGMLEFTDVQTVAHGLENVCDLLRKDRMPLTEACVNLLFEGRDFLTLLVRTAIDDEPMPSGVDDYLARLEDVVSVYLSTSREIDGTDDGSADRELQPVDTGVVDAFEAEVARLLEASSSQASPAPPPRPEISREPVVKPAAAVAAADAAPAKKKPATRHETVRVDITRLDTLLDLIGELVINRTRIMDIASTLAKSVDAQSNAAVTTLAKDLAESSALLARTTGEIQESIMKVRMVPIGTVFDRFPRMVRDLAKAYDKEIVLNVTGAETELDKTIVDEIGEPLMHLLRNSIDHGLETSDMRESIGKPRAGTISLSAYHEGNQIIIEVSDDGNGINLERVRERGIRLGMITEHDRPTDRDIIDLIFSPGFSTAEKVTDVSGRGVGMDVVKKNVLRLKGVFDVHTAAGKGTTFTIKLPLTLAIIQALLVRVADERYAIPLDTVLETQRVEPNEIKTVRGGEVIQLRGTLVPLVRIGEFFALERERVADERLMVVIVNLQGRVVGLVVDSFEGEQEIVIKPLSEVIGHIDGISGATILGNGSISLIIDVHSLVASAYDGSRANVELSGV